MPASKLDPRVSLRSLWSAPCAVCLCFLPCPVGPSPGCETWVRLPFSLSALSSSASAASSTHCCSVLSEGICIRSLVSSRNLDTTISGCMFHSGSQGNQGEACVLGTQDRSRTLWFQASLARIVESGKQLLQHDGLLLQPGKLPTAGKRMVDPAFGAHSILATTQ